MRKRRRYKQAKTLEVRLADEAKRLHALARLLPRGQLRDEVERKAIQTDAARELTEILLLPG